MRRRLLVAGVFLLFSGSIVAQEVNASRFIHRLEAEVRPGYVLPTNSFVRGMNAAGVPVRHSLSAHLKYSFQYRPHSLTGRIFGGVYQGIGVAGFTFGNPSEAGNPLALYLFQGARIVSISSRFSFNYEWNFGVSRGWKVYDRERNRFNVMMGSEMNAYINTNFYLNWVLSSRLDLTSGVTLTHFSNGNTRFPNAGLNMADFKVGLVYCFNRPESFGRLRVLPGIPCFPRHFSYDCVIFGSWRRKGYEENGEFVPSPSAYKVIGMNVAAMYNVGYKFRTGLSLDWVYDASANVFVRRDFFSTGTQHFVKPPLSAQTALGISGRAEYVMPYFTVGIGMGTNVLHRGGDLRAFYQMLVLKVAITRNSFFHIGYNLQEFRTPNYLMLGIGYRFNNKYPVICR